MDDVSKTMVSFFEQNIDRYRPRDVFEQLNIQINYNTTMIYADIPDYPRMRSHTTVSFESPNWCINGQIKSNEYMYYHLVDELRKEFQRFQYPSLYILNLLNHREIKNGCIIELIDPFHFRMTKKNDASKQFHIIMHQNKTITSKEVQGTYAYDDDRGYPFHSYQTIEMYIRQFAGVPQNPNYYPTLVQSEYTSLWPTIGRLAAIIDHISN